MEYTGQITPFPLNRKLSDQERNNQLKQDEKLPPSYINLPL